MIRITRDEIATFLYDEADLLKETLGLLGITVCA